MSITWDTRRLHVQIERCRQLDARQKRSLHNVVRCAGKADQRDANILCMCALECAEDPTSFARCMEFLQIALRGGHVHISRPHIDGKQCLGLVMH